MKLHIEMDDGENYEGCVWCYYANWIDFLNDKIDDDRLEALQIDLCNAPMRSKREIAAINDAIQLTLEYNDIFIQWITIRRLNGYEGPSEEDLKRALRHIR